MDGDWKGSPNDRWFFWWTFHQVSVDFMDISMDIPNQFNGFSNDHQVSTKLGGFSHLRAFIIWVMDHVERWTRKISGDLNGIYTSSSWEFEKAKHGGLASPLKPWRCLIEVMRKYAQVQHEADEITKLEDLGHLLKNLEIWMIGIWVSKWIDI